MKRHTDPFALLGLDRRTADEAAVKRAYAERLKVTRPEDDREAFMKLRAAFELALERLRKKPVTLAHDAGPVLMTKSEANLPTFIGPQGITTLNFELRAEGTLAEITDALEAFGEPADISNLMSIVDRDETAGIEFYLELQARVREFLCERTGYFSDSQTLEIPRWLTLNVFDALDSYYGWTRQPTAALSVRLKNDWLARVREQRVWAEDPDEARRAARKSTHELEAEKPKSKRPILKAILRFLIRLAVRLPILILFIYGMRSCGW